MRKSSSKGLKNSNSFRASEKQARSSNGSTKRKTVSTTRSSASKNGATSQRTSKAEARLPERLKFLLDESLVHKNQGRYSDAVRDLEQAVHQFPNSAIANWLLGGILYTYLRNPAAALPYLQQAVALSPKNELASLGLFNALWDLERIDEALAEIKRYQTLTNWKCQDYIDIVAEMNAKWGSPKKTTRKPKPKRETRT